MVQLEEPDQTSIGLGDENDEVVGLLLKIGPGLFVVVRQRTGPQRFAHPQPISAVVRADVPHCHHCRRGLKPRTLQP